MMLLLQGCPLTTVDCDQFTPETQQCFVDTIVALMQVGRVHAHLLPSPPPPSCAPGRSACSATWNSLGSPASCTASRASLIALSMCEYRAALSCRLEIFPKSY